MKEVLILLLFLVGSTVFAQDCPPEKQADLDCIHGLMAAGVPIGDLTVGCALQIYGIDEDGGTVSIFNEKGSSVATAAQNKADAPGCQTNQTKNVYQYLVESIQGAPSAKTAACPMCVLQSKKGKANIKKALDTCKKAGNEDLRTAAIQAAADLATSGGPKNSQRTK
jgi:hypothetical protein